VHANLLEIKDGRLTGALAADIVDASAKRAVLHAAADARGLSLGSALAVGDGANDLPMIAAAVSGAGLGVGYHPRPQLAQAANFSVRHNDLTALLFAQGVKPKDWAC
jgi:phosphoserine phosphatase